MASRVVSLVVIGLRGHRGGIEAGRLSLVIADPSPAAAISNIFTTLISLSLHAKLSHHPPVPMVDTPLDMAYRAGVSSRQRFSIRRSRTAPDSVMQSSKNRTE